MDRLIKKQQNAVLDILQQFTSNPIGNKGLEKQLIADKERNRFQVIVFGWESNNLVNTTLLHFEIKNGKIWVQQNWTEIEVAKELVARGISKKDIVLGFLPELMRADTEYAVA
jgi:exopolysaccharide biosynthesis protein